MPRRRRRAGAYPTYGGNSPTSTFDDSSDFNPFGAQPDLGGGGGEGGADGMTGGIYISNVNTNTANSISTAINEEGGGGVKVTPKQGGGGNKKKKPKPKKK